MTLPMSFVELAVQDLARSTAFYSEFLNLTPAPDPPTGSAWLAAGPAVLHLREVDGTGRLSEWRPDNQQRGFRHIGFKVSDLDKRAAQLRDAGTPFHLDPTDAHGDVRITFFFDPDGVLLEFVEGALRYDEVLDQALIDAEHARPVPTTPRFDHVAVTVADPAEAVTRYGDQLGFRPGGRLHYPDFPGGFEITYLHAGQTVLELFSWAVETEAAPSRAPDQPGFQAIGVTAPDPAAVTARIAAYAGEGALPPDADALTIQVDPLPTAPDH